MERDPGFDMCSSVMSSAASELNTSQEGSSAGGRTRTPAPFSPNHGLEPGRPAGALKFTIAELNRVTAHFSESHKIGQGGFGTVYQGKLKTGELVAIKRAKKVFLF